MNLLWWSTLHFFLLLNQLINCENIKKPLEVPQFNCTQSIRSVCELSDIHLDNNRTKFIPISSNSADVHEVLIRYSKFPVLTSNLCEAFPNLQKVVVYKAIEEVEEDAFVNCKELKHIDLWSNNIKSLKKNTFNRNGLLEFLSIGNNQLESIDADQFSGLVNLKELYLQANHLTNIPDSGFKDLGNLTVLGLHQNPLNNLNAVQMVADLKKLKNVYISGLHNSSCKRQAEILAAFKERGIEINELKNNEGGDWYMYDDTGLECDEQWQLPRQVKLDDNVSYQNVTKKPEIGAFPTSTESIVNATNQNVNLSAEKQILQVLPVPIENPNEPSNVITVLVYTVTAVVIVATIIGVIVLRKLKARQEMLPEYHRMLWRS